ncbi:MAG: IS91 family transposase [bacterium]|nr:IS91 family transposase [Elusimicrobiota bacterium]
MELISGKITIKHILQHNNNWFRFYKKHSLLIREAIPWNIDKIFNCRSKNLGFHRYQCPDCDHTITIPHSCKSRFCSSCGTLATNNWISSSLNEFLDVPYQHLIFTVPSQIRSLILCNRKLLLDILFKSTSKTILSWTKQNKSYVPGLTMVLHTFGADLTFNPHIHVLITCGGLSLDHSKWIANSYISHHALKSIWRYQIITSLRTLFKKQSLNLPNEEIFSNHTSFNDFLNTLYQKTWFVHIGKSLSNAYFTIRYIGRYTKRPVIAEARITSYDGQFVQFYFKDKSTNQTFYLKLTVEEFIANLIRHIPDKHFRQIRYAGIFASRLKTSLTTIAKKLLFQLKKSNAKILSWRERKIKSNGKDPLVCPKCLKKMFLSVIAYANKYGQLKIIHCLPP